MASVVQKYCIATKRQESSRGGSNATEMDLYGVQRPLAEDSTSAGMGCVR